MYTVGQVSKLLGVSRDTLKFYEEKGLVQPEQDEENGYRKYNVLDIHNVLSVNFYREIDLEIKQIQEIKNSNSIDDIESILIKQENKLKEELEYKKLLLNRIKSLKEDCKRIKENLNKFTIRKMNPMEIVEEIEDSDTIGKLASLQGKPFSLKKAVTLTGLTRIINFTNEGSIEDRFVVCRKINKREKNIKGEVISHEKCLYIVIEDKTTKNDEDMDNQIGELIIGTAMKMGVELVGVSYANMLVSSYEDGHSRMYLEIYTPMK